MRRKARMRLIIFLVIITLGTVALAQANRETVSVARIQQTPPTGTYFDHLVFIMMENAGMSNICGSGVNPPPCNGPDNPYMSGLANSYGLATQYVDLIGTSQPNYIGIMAATLNGCMSSCGPGTLTETNLVDRFDTAGVGWKGYMEDQTPVAGCDNNDHGFYQIAHNPFVAFHDIDTNSTRCNRIVLANPANNSTCTGTDCALVKDLNSGSAPNFIWVTPNDCNNAHGLTGCANGCISSYTSPCEKAGDNYLSSLVPNILSSNTFKNTRAALFITFDEGSGFCPLNGSGEDCMYTVWAGPTTQTNMFSSSTLRDHYAFTKTIETNWSLATMTSNDAAATAMTEFFKAQSPDFAITASPASLAFPFGNSANSNITLSSLGSFAGTVTLTKSSTPAGLTLTLNPTSVILTSGGTGTSTLTVSSSTIGNYTATVTGTSGTHIHNATLTIRVTPQPNFALSVNPTSLTLTHAVSGVASPVTIHSTGDRTVFESSYLANSFYAKGLIWLFYEDSSNTCEHQAGCLTYTTSTNGSSWAPPTTVPVHITDSDFSVTNNGTSIFYVRYNESTYISDCGRRVQLGIGNLSNSGTVAWQPEKTVIAGASNRVYADDEILLDSNGQIWIAYLMDNHAACGGNSTDLPLVIHSAGTNYNSWTGNTTLTTAHSGNWHIALVSLGSGQVYASYWIGNTDVHGRLYSNGWQADEQISSTSTLSDVNSWLFNSGTNVYIIYFDDSTQSLNFAARSSAGTWTINRIGIGESHTGSQAFPGYYSLPDAASYDLANNQFHLFYMNFTTQRIDEWTGVGSSWNKTTGVVTTGAVPYADSITSFIQSSPIEVGGIFYISGSGSPFNLNFAALTFASSGLTGSFTVTVTGQNGFAGAVILSTSTSPASGLTVTCTPTTITGGSGSSTCNLSSTTSGSYNVNVTGVSGSLSHSANVAVTVPAGPDFSITATTPSPTNVGQSQTSTITVAASNGFTGIISLSDTPPAGLTCGAITPNSITNSGTATVSCNATVAGNYTLTLTGTSSPLSHSTTVLFQFRDFNASVSQPAPVNAGSSAISTITVTSINHFNSVVTLTDTVPSGLICGAISPPSLTGSGTAAVSCSASAAGNYTLTLTGTSGTLVRTAISLFQFRNFTITASSPSPANAGSPASATITVTAINHFAGVVSLTDTAPSGLTCGSITPSSVTGSGTATVSCSANVAGNYTLTLTGTSGSLVHTATSFFQFVNFTIGASSPGPVNAGSSSITTITVTSLNHFAGVVSLTDTLPSGLTCGSISPNSVTGSGTATISCNATIAGNYTLTVKGTSGSLVHSATALFQFRDFNSSASSPSPVNAGSSAVSAITVTSINHFNGAVSLTDTVPSGLSCGSVIPTSVTGSGTATVSCSATIAGNYTLTITGTSGSLIHSATTLFQFRDFTMSIAPTIPVNAGNLANSTITVAAVNHFGGQVSLTDTLPSGLTCGAINPPTVTGSGSATISCSANIAGNYTLTITGTNSALSHNATLIISVRDYSTTANPVSAKINAGSNGSSAITVIPLNHFSGTVSLSSTGTSGLTSSIIPTSIPGGSGTATLTFSASLAGNYTVTVNTSSGTLSHKTIINVQVVDFMVAANTSNITILAGTRGNSTVIVSGVNGFTGNVNLVLTSGNGLTATIAPSSIVGSGSSTLSLSSSSPGDYSVMIKATSGSLSHRIGILVHVLDYSVAGSPINLVAPVGSNSSSTLTLQSLNGYAGNVTLTFGVDPDPGTMGGGGSGGGRVPLTLAPPTVLPIVSISPQLFQLFPGGSQQATVSVSLPSNLPAGNYLITITTIDGSLSHQLVLTVVATDFSMTATPNSATMKPGSNSTIVVNLGSINFFQGNVTLTVTSQAGGPTGSLSATLVQLTSFSNANLNLTIQVPAATALGNYTITVQATSGTLSHTLTIPVSVTATGFVVILADFLNDRNAPTISAAAIITLLTIFATIRLTGHQIQNLSTIRRSRRENRVFRRSAATWYIPHSSSLPVLWVRASRN